MKIIKYILAVFAALLFLLFLGCVRLSEGKDEMERVYRAAMGFFEGD